MSDSDDHNRMPEDEWLAAEVALGVLSGPERVAAAARMVRDAAFARQVAAWDERLSPWAGEIDEVVPPVAVWERIAAALPAPPTRRGLWQSLLFWRGLAFATSVLAAACIGALIYLGTVVPAPPLVASIEGGGQRQFIATVDRERTTIAVVPAAFSADPTRVPELWLIPPGGKPLPLGLLQADRAVTIPLPPTLAAQTTSSAALAVSLEPPGGSPSAAPTGPVIGQGKLTIL